MLSEPIVAGVVGLVVFVTVAVAAGADVGTVNRMAGDAAM